MNIAFNRIQTIQRDNETITLAGKCPFCQNEWIVQRVPIDGFTSWRMGEHIQAALPSLTPQQREYLISGVCADCWSKL